MDNLKEVIVSVELDTKDLIVGPPNPLGEVSARAEFSTMETTQTRQMGVKITWELNLAAQFEFSEFERILFSGTLSDFQKNTCVRRDVMLMTFALKATMQAIKQAEHETGTTTEFVLPCALSPEDLSEIFAD